MVVGRIISRVTVSTMASMGYRAMITLWSRPEKLSSLRYACSGETGQRLLSPVSSCPSAFPSIADVRRGGCYVRVVPEADISFSMRANQHSLLKTRASPVPLNRIAGREREMSAIWDLWSLSAAGPFTTGSAQMTKAELVTTPQEFLTTL